MGGLEKAFKGVDADSSGKISAKEMNAHITKVYGAEMDESIVKEMFKVADTTAMVRSTSTSSRSSCAPAPTPRTATRPQMPPRPISLSTRSAFLEQSNTRLSMLASLEQCVVVQNRAQR